MKRDEMEKAIRDLLAATELPESEIMSDSAERVAKAWEEELLSGYAMNPSDAVGELIPATEDEKATVVMKGIKFHSMCSHHLLPFQGTVALGYQPGEGGILGLGSLDTIVQDPFTGRQYPRYGDGNAVGGCKHILAYRMARGDDTKFTTLAI